MQSTIKFPSEVIDYLKCRKGTVDFAGQVKRGYRQYLTLKSLPFPRSVLDIGCGLGVIDVFLARAGVQEIHLMDGDGSGERRDDYGADVEAWNDVRLAEQMVRWNAPARTEIYTHQANPNLRVNVDMIISFKSWGTHYPISVYASLARHCLAEGGLVVLDIRKGETWRPVEGLRLVRHLSERQVVLACE